jgi:hypothetical protein
MDKVFQAVRNDVEGRGIDGVFIARIGLAAFGFQNIVRDAPLLAKDRRLLDPAARRRDLEAARDRSGLSQA